MTLLAIILPLAFIQFLLNRIFYRYAGWKYLTMFSAFSYILLTLIYISYPYFYYEVYFRLYPGTIRCGMPQIGMMLFCVFILLPISLIVQRRINRKIDRRA